MKLAGHCASVEGTNTEGAEAGFAVVGTAVVGFAVVGTAVVGFAVVGFAVVGFAVVGFAVVGFAVVGFAVACLLVFLLDFECVLARANDGSIVTLFPILVVLSLSKQPWWTLSAVPFKTFTRDQMVTVING